LDRIVGYELSGLIWKKVRYGLSAGRVQSPALRIICEREREIRAFVPEEFYAITADFTTTKKKHFTASCTVVPKTAAEASDIVDKGKRGEWIVSDVTTAPVKRAPKPPFTTSTLQQAASSRLGYSPSRTMRTAQKLYEAGLITYMRTDSMNLAAVALSAIASFVKKEYGEKYLEARVYKTRSKNAQEAHEAIRPTDISKARAGATEEEHRLYELIRSRTIASQMADAVMSRTKITASTDGVPDFTATGSTIAFDGWLAADPSAKGEEVILPEVLTGERLELENIASEQKFTEPPPRYTEAGLVKELEKRGIGRPSTYASIIKTIVDRGYVLKEGRSLKSTATGEVVDSFLGKHFEKYISDSFTAEMENELDQIATGEREYAETLKNFYVPFARDVKSKEKIDKVTTLGDAPKEFPCPLCGNAMVMKLGRAGVFMSCARFPDCVGSRTETGAVIKADEPIGTHPETGHHIYVKRGRFGPYLEMTEKLQEKKELGAKGKKKRGEKIDARRASIPVGVSPETVTVEDAVKYLSLPRALGEHPESQKTITASTGRFGPYIVHEGDFRSLKGADNPYEITLVRALEILKEPKKTRPGVSFVREIGEHPRTKRKIMLYKSKSGHFLKKGFKRIMISDEKAPSLSPEEAAEILKSA
jgi:DNA topoisomerase-1